MSPDMHSGKAISASQLYRIHASVDRDENDELNGQKGFQIQKKIMIIA